MGVCLSIFVVVILSVSLMSSVIASVSCDDSSTNFPVVTVVTSSLLSVLVNILSTLFDIACAPVKLWSSLLAPSITTSTTSSVLSSWFPILSV